jgi:hypothetical protein
MSGVVMAVSSQGWADGPAACWATCLSIVWFREFPRFGCPRSESQLTYMIDIALTAEFAVDGGR